MDGLKLYIERSPNDIVQECFYNGWKADHYVTNVFVFCPDGTIPNAFFNAPGSIHDSQVAEWGGIYDKLEIMYDKYHVRCTSNSDFGKINRDYLLKTSQDYVCSDSTTLR